MFKFCINYNGKPQYISGESSIDISLPTIPRDLAISDVVLSCTRNFFLCRLASNL